jgi:biopolymer transport protein ExbB/TolQ
MDQILKIADVAIYGAIAAVALLGLFWIVLLWFRVGQKRFSSSARADQFLDEVRERLGRKDYDGVAELCDSPPYWSKATPQLILVAMQNLDRPMGKLRRMLAERFEVDVLSSLEYGTSWIATFAKSAPMLGLLGTVVGMIAAFAKIATAQSSGIKPEALAGDISFALFTTAYGLMIAIPLVVGGNFIHIRIGKLQDGVQADLTRFLDDLERSAESAKGAPA